jgi:hypothetical protein
MLILHGACRLAVGLPSPLASLAGWDACSSCRAQAEARVLGCVRSTAGDTGAGEGCPASAADTAGQGACCRAISTLRRHERLHVRDLTVMTACLLVRSKTMHTRIHAKDTCSLVASELMQRTGSVVWDCVALLRCRCHRGL